MTPNVAARYRGRKVVTVADLALLDFDTSRGSFGRRLATRQRLPFRPIFRHQMTTAWHIVTLTEFVRDLLIERFRVDRRNVSPAWLAADSDQLTAADEESVACLDAPGPFLLHTGNHYPYKNVRLLIEALALGTKTWPDAKLVLAGRSDEFKDSLRSLARTLAVSDRVVMPGFATDGQLKWRRLAFFSWRKTAEITHRVYLDVGQQMSQRTTRAWRP